MGAIQQTGIRNRGWFKTLKSLRAQPPGQASGLSANPVDKTFSCKVIINNMKDLFTRIHRNQMVTDLIYGPRAILRSSSRSAQQASIT